MKRTTLLLTFIFGLMALPAFAQHAPSDEQSLTTNVNSIAFVMKKITAGTFNMGCTGEMDGSDCYDWEKPAHTVTLTTDYYLGETEVTQALWRAVMGVDPPQLVFPGCDECPVESVSWEDVQTFLQKLNQKTGQTYRLPTEAEWEFAARGGTLGKKYKYSGSNDINAVAWYDANAYGKTHSIKGKAPNELGLYDMSGNVYEWCQDWWGDYSSSAQTNPTGPNSGSNRVIRGGSWVINPRFCRASYRGSNTPQDRHYNLGFRLAKTR